MGVVQRTHVLAMTGPGMPCLNGGRISRRKGIGKQRIWDVTTASGDHVGEIWRDRTRPRWIFEVDRTEIFTDPNRLALMAKVMALGAMRAHEIEED